jgi:hypothetical protein
MGFGALPQLPVAATVVKVHVTGPLSAFPATSVTPLVNVAVYSVLFAKRLVGVRVAVKVVLLYVTLAATGVVPGPWRVKVLAVRVLGLRASLNVAVTVVFVATPVAPLAGVRPVKVGGVVSGGKMVNVCALEVPPPGAGVRTVTLALPDVAMSLAEMAAVSVVAETTVVVRGLPFHWTTEVLMKFVPVTVRVKAGPPAAADVGLRAVVVGTGLLIVKVRAPDVPPPGVGLKTFTEAVPAVAMSVAPIVAWSWVAET